MSFIQHRYHFEFVLHISSIFGCISMYHIQFIWYSLFYHWKSALKWIWICTAYQKHKKANRIKRFWIFFLCQPLLFISKYKIVRCERFRAFSFRFIKLSEGRNLFCKCETGRCWYARSVFQFYTLICTCTWRILCFYSCMSHVLLFRIKMLTEKKKQTDFIAT